MRKLLHRAIGRARNRLCARFKYVRVSYLSPREVVLITTRHEGVQNIWPIDWHVPLSYQPSLYGISVTPNSYGTTLIRKSGVFVVNFMPLESQGKIIAAGRMSGRDTDKIKTLDFPTAEAETIDAPRVEDALGYLECEVLQSHPVGDHLFVVGCVKHAVETKEGERLAHMAIRSGPLESADATGPP